VCGTRLHGRVVGEASAQTRWTFPAEFVNLHPTTVFENFEEFGVSIFSQRVSPMFPVKIPSDGWLIRKGNSPGKKIKKRKNFD
jgi:hypothetical protein